MAYINYVYIKSRRCKKEKLLGDQAYSRLSTTHGHITDCKLGSVVYVGVCV